MKSTLKILLLTLMSFLLYQFFLDNYFSKIFHVVNNWIHLYSVSYFIAYLAVGLPFVPTVLMMHSRYNFFSSLGIAHGFIKGSTVAFIATLPMLIGFALFFKLATDISLNSLLVGTVFAAFFEELYFRGILFGQIYRFTRIGFLPAVLLGAIFFALGHLYQSQEPATIIGVFITTFMGAVLFAWTYIEWQNNLWVSIGLHFFMNLYWMLFSAGENALGGFEANVFRMATIALVIVGTIIYKKRKGFALNITFKTLLLQKPSSVV